jgi:hypothetical protein
MRRPVLLVALLAAACGSDVDPRPATLSYILPAILEPGCATASCHAGDAAPTGLRFDDREVEALLEELTERTLIFPGQPAASPLLHWLRGSAGVPVRMPPDQPLPGADIALIERWIADGAPP